MSRMLSVGQRVKIINDCGIAKGVEGVIAYPPATPILDYDFGGNYFRGVDTLKGKVLFFWVVFDSPQFDSDGDGPYPEAEISIENLEIIKPQ